LREFLRRLWLLNDERRDVLELERLFNTSRRASVLIDSHVGKIWKTWSSRRSDVTDGERRPTRSKGEALNWPVLREPSSFVGLYCFSSALLQLVSHSDRPPRRRSESVKDGSLHVVRRDHRHVDYCCEWQARLEPTRCRLAPWENFGNSTSDLRCGNRDRGVVARHWLKVGGEGAGQVNDVHRHNMTPRTGLAMLDLGLADVALPRIVRLRRGARVPSCRLIQAACDPWRFKPSQALPSWAGMNFVQSRK
jgi:hypothetical protein